MYVTNIWIVLVLYYPVWANCFFKMSRKDFTFSSPSFRHSTTKPGLMVGEEQ